MSILELEDIAPRIITVKIESTDGLEREIDIRMPTLTEWNESILGVDYPDPKKYIETRIGKEGKKEDFINYDNPEYVLKHSQAIEETNLRRVTQALLGAGNFPSLQRLSLKEATQELREKADKGIIDGVHQALRQIISSTKGGVETKKASFRNQSAIVGSNGNLPQNELVKEVLG